MDPDLKRRDFFYTAVRTAALATFMPACFLKQRDAGEPVHYKQRMQAPESGPPALPPTRVYPEMPRATVSITKVRYSVYAAVRDAVQAAGGLDEIEPGQSVMIKPNMCGPAIRKKYPGPITTNPEVLRAVIRLVKERGAHVMVTFVASDAKRCRPY